MLRVEAISLSGVPGLCVVHGEPDLQPTARVRDANTKAEHRLAAITWSWSLFQPASAGTRQKALTFDSCPVGLDGKLTVKTHVATSGFSHYLHGHHHLLCSHRLDNAVDAETRERG